ncbi:MAG TPA: Uma2 family endonuclease [Gemmataceae bacterium]|nr:Uma2 family endonuclease [Gemmataceae bacterium]
MSLVQTKKEWVTVAELLKKLGGIPGERVLLDPPPGTATEKDVLEVERREGRICELVDGVLVEKAMGLAESFLALEIAFFLQLFLKKHKLGILAGADGTLRLWPGLVRIPDVSFISWDQLPQRKIPKKAIPELYPDLAVEVLSRKNTKPEIDRKLHEYFRAGTRLAWVVDPRKRTVHVYTAPDQSHLLTANQSLDGGDVLPGLSLPLRELFAQLEEEPTPKKRRKR